MSEPRLIVLTGGSGVGKSTLARELQRELLPDCWLHYSVDTVLACYPAELQAQANQHNDWSGIDVKKLLRSSYAGLRVLLEQGHAVIFDAVVMTERAAGELVLSLPELPVLWVQLHCHWPELRRRTLARGDRSLAEAERGFHHADGHLEVDLRLNSGSQEPRPLALAVREALSRVHESEGAWRRNQRRYAVQQQA